METSIPDLSKSWALAELEGELRMYHLLSTGDPNLDDLLVDPESSDWKLSYIDIPVLLKVRLGDRFRISAGPQVSILTGATDTYMSSPIDGTVLTTELDIKLEINTIDAGAVIDFEYILAPTKGGKGINLYVRYYKGFIDLLKENSGDRFTTSMIQFGATFPFVGKWSWIVLASQLTFLKIICYSYLIIAIFNPEPWKEKQTGYL